MAKEDELVRKSEDHPAAQNSEDERPKLVEVTTYIREDQAFALELMENAERGKRGTNFDRAELFQEALDLLIRERLIAIRLPGSRIAPHRG
ncbi:MAG TPA: hypothetical protein VJT09_04255 [Pyrinomonadaceae bacterium]|nr:hypothetical protein [Pyrinomonadaceae bacterium]